MIDYVFVNKLFCTSVLDTCVYRLTPNESDHELVLSTFHFKLKAKLRQTWSIHYQATSLPSSYRVSYQSALAESLEESDQISTVDSLWDTFKFPSRKPVSLYLFPGDLAIQTGSTIKSVHNLSLKKQETRICLKNAISQDTVSHRTEYMCVLPFQKLTKVAIVNTCNFWYGATFVVGLNPRLS